MRGSVVVLIRLALLIAILAIWECLPRAGIVNPILLPPPSEVLTTLIQIMGRDDVHVAIAVTAAEIAVAFLVAVPLGGTLGVLSAENAYFGAIFKPMLFYVFSIPKSMFLPMFILAFGIGFPEKVAYATFSTIFIVIMSAGAAVESVKAEHLLVAQSYGATRVQILRRVYMPSMMPILLETLRVAMIFNVTGVLIAEMYASRTGIGNLLANWGGNFQMPRLFAGVVLVAAAAMLFNAAIRSLEARCSTWRT
jgi:NitT/TauT family transport system permease protein